MHVSPLFAVCVLQTTLVAVEVLAVDAELPTTEVEVGGTVEVDVELLEVEVGFGTGVEHTVIGVQAQILSQLSQDGFDSLMESTVVPNMVAIFAHVSPATAVYVRQEPAATNAV